MSEQDKLQIINYLRIDPDKWDLYVNNHARGTIFQTLSYLACHTHYYNCECFGFAAVKGDVIVGLVAGVISYNYFPPINYLTRRAIIEGGPIANNTHIVEALIASVDEYTNRKAIYTQYRNLWEMDEVSPIMKRLFYQYEPHLDIIHDLTIEKDLIIKSISKNKRGNIHKAINKGALFREARKIEWDRCIDLILGTYKRVGLPCQNRSYFINSFKSLSDRVKIFVATLDDTIIGTRVELCYKKMVYDWYAGSDDKYKNYYPNDFLPYCILLWAKDNNYLSFDFGGAGRPEVPYGVREHKMKFGGQLVEYGRFVKINNKLIYNIASKIVDWKRNNKKNR